MRLIKRSQREREKKTKNVFKIEIKADFNSLMITLDLSAFLNENARNEFKYTCHAML